MTDDRQELRDRYPRLSYLLAGYFHQDWVEDAETEDEVLAAFVARNDEDVISEAARNAADLIEVDGADEERLAHVVDMLGGEIYPPGGGITYRQFLERVAALGESE
jgi:hypothetical protein